MIVKNLKLRNFRNYTNCSIQFKPSLNIILGRNAQGKTNLLESLFFLSTTRSHRVYNDQALIKDGMDFAKIECTFIDENEMRISSVINHKGKTLMKNDTAIQKSSSFIGLLNVILFAPSDLNIFDESPRERRKIIDVEITKVSNTYLEALNSYQKLLKQRNTLLKNSSLDHTYLSVLEKQMIQYQVVILRFRKQFIDCLNENINRIYKALTNEDNQIKIHYLSCVEVNDQVQSNLELMFQNNFERDILLQVTNAGIHRDDISFEFKGKKVEEVASQGQKRMIVIAFKLSLITYIKKMKKKLPVLLLDDVLSELDEGNQIRLLRFIQSRIQTIITATSIDTCKSIMQYNPTIIYIDSGEVVKHEEETR